MPEQDISKIIEEAIQHYRPTGEFAKIRGEQLTEKKATVVPEMQARMIGAGLAGTTVGASIPAAFERQFAKPWRTETEMLRSARLMESVMAKAGIMERAGAREASETLIREQMELQRQLQQGQITSQEYMQKMQLAQEKSLAEQQMAIQESLGRAQLRGGVGGAGAAGGRGTTYRAGAGAPDTFNWEPSGGYGGAGGTGAGIYGGELDPGQVMAGGELQPAGAQDSLGKVTVGGTTYTKYGIIGAPGVKAPARADRTGALENIYKKSMTWLDEPMPTGM